MLKKKILFLVGTLEQGKCGVADYTHILADRLRKEGHICVSVAINDRYLCDSHSSIAAPIDGKLFTYYRFSSTLSWRYRSLQLNNILESFNPSFVSVQFVPYSFSDKGLPLHFLQLLKSLNGEFDWQIMAHELWIIPKKGFLKKLFSFCQKAITLNIFKSIRPKAINVSNLYYKRILSESGIKASILPIFSNIPYTKPSDVSRKSQTCWKFVSFGRLSKDWNYRYFFNRIESVRLSFGIKECHFFLLGKCGEYGESVWSQLAQQCSEIYPAFHFVITGSLSCDQISQHFHSANFGICSTPFHLVDKSGASAAMIAHGLPVIVQKPNDMKIPNDLCSITPHRYILLDENFEANISSIETTRNSIDQLSLTSQQFIYEMDTTCI